MSVVTGLVSFDGRRSAGYRKNITKVTPYVNDQAPHRLPGSGYAKRTIVSRDAPQQYTYRRPHSNIDKEMKKFLETQALYGSTVNVVPGASEGPAMSSQTRPSPPEPAMPDLAVNTPTSSDPSVSSSNYATPNSGVSDNFQDTSSSDSIYPGSSPTVATPVVLAPPQRPPMIQTTFPPIMEPVSSGSSVPLAQQMYPSPPTFYAEDGVLPNWSPPVISPLPMYSPARPGYTVRDPLAPPTYLDVFGRPYRGSSTSSGRISNGYSSTGSSPRGSTTSLNIAGLRLGNNSMSEDTTSPHAVMDYELPGIVMRRPRSTRNPNPRHDSASSGNNSGGSAYIP